MKIGKHFLDSGAFSQKTKAKAFHKKYGGDRWAYYETDEFHIYMEKYTAFVKQYKAGIDIYANVDVIGNEELTWRNQQWLEKKGLHPIPVVHYPRREKEERQKSIDDLKWLRHYLNLGYDLIGIGGLAARTGLNSGCNEWLRRCFDLICDNPERLPTVKIHGFGVTDYKRLITFPWYSVDSTTWLKRGVFGEILVPCAKDNAFRFYTIDAKTGHMNALQPYIVGTSMKHRGLHKQTKHFWNLKHIAENNPHGRDCLYRHICRWLEEIEVDKDKLFESGEERTKANLRFFQRLSQSLPRWPWSFGHRTKGFET